MSYIIDANVILLAGTNIANIPEEQLGCALKCIDFLQSFMRHKYVLVLDDGWRILKEYEKNCRSIKGYPNHGTNFLKWIFQNQRNQVQFYPLKESEGQMFEPYPDSQAALDFDPSDRKYIALAFLVKDHPPIVEASDSKWWGIAEELRKFGLQICFIDEDYIKQVYEHKFTMAQK